MANRPKQPSKPLSTPVNAAKSALDRANNVAGEVVDNVADLTEPVRDLAASVVGILSPTAARAIHPERGAKDKAAQEPARKRARAATNKVSAAALKAASRTTTAAGEGASRAVKAANRTVDSAQSAAARAVRGTGRQKKR